MTSHSGTQGQEISRDIFVNILSGVATLIMSIIIGPSFHDPMICGLVAALIVLEILGGYDIIRRTHGRFNGKEQALIWVAVLFAILGTMAVLKPLDKEPVPQEPLKPLIQSLSNQIRHLEEMLGTLTAELQRVLHEQAEKGPLSLGWPRDWLAAFARLVPDWLKPPPAVGQGMGDATPTSTPTDLASTLQTRIAAAQTAVAEVTVALGQAGVNATATVVARQTAMAATRTALAPPAAATVQPTPQQDAATATAQPNPGPTETSPTATATTPARDSATATPAATTDRGPGGAYSTTTVTATPSATSTDPGPGGAGSTPTTTTTATVTASPTTAGGDDRSTSTATATSSSLTATPVTPTRTAAPATATGTATPVPPTATPTHATATATPGAPTHTPVTPTRTWTATAIPPTWTATATSVPPTRTPTVTPTAMLTVTPIATRWPIWCDNEELGGMWLRRPCVVKLEPVYYCPSVNTVPPHAYWPANVPDRYYLRCASAGDSIAYVLP